MHSGPCIRRHDKIVKHFQKFIKEVRPSAVVEVEPPLGIDTYCRADLRVADGRRGTLYVVWSSCQCPKFQSKRYHDESGEEACSTTNIEIDSCWYSIHVQDCS